MNTDIFVPLSGACADSMIRELLARPLNPDLIGWLADMTIGPQIQEDEAFRMEANAALAAWAQDNPDKQDILRVSVARCLEHRDPTGVRRSALAWIGLSV